MELFTVTSEIKQGYVLPPLLFITYYIDSIGMEAKLRNENNINTLLFPDVQALIGNTARKLQQHLMMNQECKTNNIRISKDKTETMAIGEKSLP